MTLDELIAAAEVLRAAHAGNACIVLEGLPMPVVRTLEAVKAVKIRPTAYALTESSGERPIERVILIKS